MYDKDGRIVNVGDDVYSPVNCLCQVLSISDDEAWLQPIGKDYGPIRVSVAHVKLDYLKIRSMPDLAATAIVIQDACNLSGVVHSFSQLLTELRIRLDSEGLGGTQNVNHHPIAVLFSSKIASLTYSDSLVNYSNAYDNCQRMIEG